MYKLSEGFGVELSIELESVRNALTFWTLYYKSITIDNILNTRLLVELIIKFLVVFISLAIFLPFLISYVCFFYRISFRGGVELSVVYIVSFRIFVSGSLAVY